MSLTNEVKIPFLDFCTFHDYPFSTAVRDYFGKQTFTEEDWPKQLEKLPENLKF